MIPELSERQRRILARLIAEFIEQGEPVSSAWLAAHSALGVSSATVRNILARLEEQGLVRQPHTSAGRIPTDSGYRLYVDWLLGARKATRRMADVEARLRKSGTVGELMESVSHELSRASHTIAFAMAPANQSVRLEHLDFAKLEGTRVLVIVVASGGQVVHKVIETREPCDATTLSQAANYINSEFTGLTLHEARTAIVERLRQERVLYNALVARALELARNGLEGVATEETLYVQGTSFLLDELLGGQDHEQHTLATLRELFRMIEEKHQLVELLTDYIEENGLMVVIGSEHSSPDLRPFSLVASTFQDGSRTGTVGVIGPTRMRYGRAIDVVEGVSAAITRVLEGNKNDG